MDETRDPRTGVEELLNNIFLLSFSGYAPVKLDSSSVMKYTGEREV